MMTKFERIERCIQGQETDRRPIALWKHFPHHEKNPKSLVRASVAWQKNDFDLLKVMSPANYCVYDRGVRVSETFNHFGARTQEVFPLKAPEDWMQLKMNDLNSGALLEQLQVLQELRKKYADSVPLFATVFSPIFQAYKLSGHEALQQHLEEEPNWVAQGLMTLSKSTALFLKAIAKIGISGIYWVEEDQELGDNFSSLVKDLDSIINRPLSFFRWNILHVHKGSYNFKRYKECPFHILNHHGLWHDKRRYEFRKLFPGALLGGLRRSEELCRLEPNELKRVCNQLIASCPNRFMIGADCGLKINTEETSLKPLFTATRCCGKGY